MAKGNTVRLWRRSLIVLMVMLIAGFGLLIFRLVQLQIVEGETLQKGAVSQQLKDTTISAKRGTIYDCNMKPLAQSANVWTVVLEPAYLTDKEDQTLVANGLAEILGMEAQDIMDKMNPNSYYTILKKKVESDVKDAILQFKTDNEITNGIRLIEDYKRYYPYESLASKVLGFTGADNQGIIGLEVKYEKYLKGMDGLILTPTDTRGIEMENALEQREEPVPGNNLTTTIDVNIQQYAEQIAYNTLEAKGANYVSIIVMNPNNGEVLAMVNAPEFNLNEPYKLNYEISGEDKKKKKQDLLNKMWRNQCINDTYEPGSTFKVVTATAALENNVVTLDSRFSCPGFRIVDDRKIRCHKTTGHGAETFLQGTMNSCNPVFIDVGLKVGVKKFYKELDKLGLLQKTGIDIPGEAGTIIHQIKNVGNVELATMSFGQSFQITPVQYLVAASAVVNGGKLVTPHFALKAENVEGDLVEKFGYKEKKGVVSKETSDTMKYVLEKVISEGTGSKGQVEGYKVGGKTATSQKLPRGSGRYIASFMGFAPADNPRVIAMAIIDEPEGIYYGGQVAAPVISELYRNILPYLLEEKEQGE